MFVLWFIIGIVLICCISRYNESNKLFWTLFASYVGAFALTTVLLSAHNKPSKENVDQVYSTQLCEDTSNAMCALLTDVFNTTNGTEKSEPVAVSKSTPEPINIRTISEDCMLRIVKPFNPQLCIPISTHLDQNDLFLGVLT